MLEKAWRMQCPQLLKISQKSIFWCLFGIPAPHELHGWGWRVGLCQDKWEGGDDFRDETWVLVKWAHRPPRHSAGPGACLKAGGNTGKALIPDWQLTRKPNLWISQKYSEVILMQKNGALRRASFLGSQNTLTRIAPQSLENSPPLFWSRNSRFWHFNCPGFPPFRHTSVVPVLEMWSSLCAMLAPSLRQNWPGMDTCSLIDVLKEECQRKILPKKNTWRSLPDGMGLLDKYKEISPVF